MTFVTPVREPSSPIDLPNYIRNHPESGQEITPNVLEICGPLWSRPGGSSQKKVFLHKCITLALNIQNNSGKSLKNFINELENYKDDSIIEKYELSKLREDTVLQEKFANLFKLNMLKSNFFKWRDVKSTEYRAKLLQRILIETAEIALKK